MGPLQLRELEELYLHHFMLHATYGGGCSVMLPPISMLCSPLTATNALTVVYSPLFPIDFYRGCELL